MWIGIDDTDGPEGGCTTFVLTELLRVARAHDLDLLGPPRLVRLNPNVPWKTRGNAALSFQVGVGSGPRRATGRLPEGPIREFARGTTVPTDRRDRFLRDAWAAVLRSSAQDRRADPAMVAAERRPSEAFYTRAVREVVPIPDARAEVRNIGGTAFVRGSARGLVGAVAAIAWRARRSTWELIAYRKPGRFGAPREVDPVSVVTVSERYSELFQCVDPSTRRILIAPHTRCPILFGLRARSPDRLPRAMADLRTEPIERWIVFRTNQGTGDHIVDREGADFGPYRSGRITGFVSAPPQRQRGGHVAFELTDPLGGTVRCVAFEPTKLLPKVGASLALGDRLRVWGGRGRDPTLRLEGITILEAPPRPVGTLRPWCPECRRRARSLGTARGYRCPGCGARFAPERAVPRFVRAPFGRGSYHPTPSARRHLHPVVRVGTPDRRTRRAARE